MVYFVYTKLKQKYVSKDIITKNELKRIQDSEKSKSREKMWWEKL